MSAHLFRMVDFNKILFTSDDFIKFLGYAVCAQSSVLSNSFLPHGL